MIKTEKKQTENQLLHGLVSVYGEIDASGDNENAKKLLELIKKVNDHEYTIGFCGHFSAGKSSMINEIMGEEILPSSPIPTSANIVKIKSGTEYVRIHFRSGEIAQYPIPYDFDLIKTYCKNGEEIDALEISHQTKQLSDGVTVMDTPGIDSTDEKHQKATMSALHLADLILYVMDYNHVQSELNFQFTKMLKDEGKTVYLIINQVDKHQDNEITFSDFQKGVSQAFQNWNVHADGIFYTSVRNKTLPNNELNLLKQVIAEHIEHKEINLLASVKVSAHKLIQDHLSYLRDTTRSEQLSYEKLLSTLTEVEKEDIDVVIKKIENKLRIGQETLEQANTQFKQESESILNNAYMMPFETRELAKLFLESSQTNFKVGLFFTKAKTEQEKNDRLNRFYDNLQQIVSNQLERHLQQFMISFLKTWKITNPDLLKAAQTLTVPFSPTLLENVIKKGAGLSGDYLLTYTSDVATEIKRLYRREISALFDKIKETLKITIETKASSLLERLAEYKGYQDAIRQLEFINETRELAINKLQDIVEGKCVFNHHITLDELLNSKINRPILKKNLTDLSENQEQRNEVHLYHEENQAETHPNQTFTNKVTKTVLNLRKSNELVKEIRGLKLIASELGEKATRLEQQNYTVALFGAFSAGKSSFANALMGDTILPVSPNPTTATINKIVPPNKENKHGTVKVKLKTNEQLLHDIQYSLKIFDIAVSTLDEALVAIKERLSTNVEAKEKTHDNFLKAVEIGYSHLADQLGTVISVGIDGFKEFVAKEEKACFVEWIELYYDCPLTQKGITLVDTPGADSVNARHTGVAFEYIKNADAILFVTYYNHAFSKADREFLIQLGRVKDTFAMDKMFFIVNAADLASSTQEMTDVVQYVGDQLVTYGIRKPRLYPVSSQMALNEVLGKKVDTGVLKSSGIAKFEVDFNHFIIEELTEIAIKSANEDMKRVIHILANYVESAKESNESKVAKIKSLTEEQNAIQAIIGNNSLELEHEAIKQEIEELMYYINQRIFLRYPDVFKESFNPAVLREDVSNIKHALKKCLVELIDFIGHDLTQEMRATSLRVEKFLRMKTEDVFLALFMRSKQIQKALELTPLRVSQFPSIEYDESFRNIDIDTSQFKKVLSIYKNAKSFFENNEKKEMSEALENLLKTPVSDYLLKNKDDFILFYQTVFTDTIAMLKQQASVQVSDYYDGMLSILENKQDVASLEAIKTQLEEMVEA